MEVDNKEFFKYTPKYGKTIGGKYIYFLCWLTCLFQMPNCSAFEKYGRDFFFSPIFGLPKKKSGS